MADDVSREDQSGDERRGYDSIKGDEPFSLLNLVNDALIDAIKRIPDEDMGKPEHIIRRSAKPTGVDYSLRLSFWREFEETVRYDRGKLVTRRIFAGVCTDHYFYAKFLHNPWKVLWMIQPMQSYRREVESMLAEGNARMRKILRIPFKDKKGKWLTQNVSLFLRARDKLEERAYGMAVQRVEQKTKGVVAHVTAPRALTVGSESELREQIRQLEAEVIDGTQADADQDGSAPGGGQALPARDGNAGRKAGGVEDRAGVASAEADGADGDDDLSLET